MTPRFDVPMIGGEIHYGRVLPRYWSTILDSARSLGVQVIGAYVMWDLHEVREGEYDFASLHAFLEMVEQRGFKLLARPGPFFYSEWRNMGIPDHAVPFHKTHPEFQRKAAHWVAAAMHELRPYFGRLIVAVQADNEIDPMPHFYGEDQGFAEWLRERYGSIEALNAAWGTAYRGFEEPIPWLAAQLEPPRLPLRRVADSCQYRYDLATRYARWIVAEYRKHDCPVPILLNTWPGVDAQHWRDLSELADFYGIDPYPTNECRADFRYFRERLRLLRAVTRFPYISEFGSGIWHGMPNRDYTPDHYRLTAMTALASGARGWNWYMLVNRDNWYGAPINERGVIHPELGEPFRDAVRDFKQLIDAPPPEVSCGVTWSWRYHQLAQIAKRDADDALLPVLHEMGLEYDFVDVDRDFVAIADPPEYAARGGSAADVWPRLLLVAGEISEPRRLWRFVEAGGNLVLFQRLIDGCPLPDGTSHPGAERLEITITEDSRRVSFLSNGAVFAYRNPPGRPIVATQLPWRLDEDQRRLMELALGRTYTTGCVQRHGAGTLMLLGCPPSRDAILAVHRFFGASIPVLPMTAGVHATKRGSRVLAFHNGETKSAKLALNWRGDDAFEPRYIDLPRCGGAIVQL